ncbi:MAG: hypothetical protein JXR07_07615 [Reichenbachiella sp.]
MPPSIKWQQINSEHFRIIFTEGFEDNANNITNMLERIYVPASNSLGVQPRRIPIILQNNISSSNGFVTIGPLRSEFHTLSPQLYTSTGNDEWMAHLASHEYRHIVQFEKALSKFNKFMYVLFGEYGAGFMAGIAAPSWFFEGDAVGLETSMGRTGRGRTPSFLMAFKANTMEKGGFHYYKQHLKSFRDFVPNHYVTGYLMTTHIKNENGTDIWGKITHDAFRHSFIPFTFSNSIKKHTGNYLLPAYKEMMEKQKELFSRQLSQINPTPFETLSLRKRKEYTNYKYPKLLVDSTIVCLKNGMGDPIQFVRINSEGKEKTLTRLGYYSDAGFLSANDSILVWVEQEFDPRWYNRSYQVIKKLNIIDGKIKRITNKSRYTSAAISKDGKTIIATHQTLDSKHNLHLLDANTGDIIKSFDNPENTFYTTPSFSENQKYIVVLKDFQDGKSMVMKSIETGHEKEVAHMNEEIIGHPIQHGEYIFYNSTFNGVDNIFCIGIESKNTYQITNSKYGAFNPEIDKKGKVLIYNEYTVDGMEIVSTPLNHKKWTLKENVKYVGFDFQKTMVQNENIENHLYGKSDSLYSIEKYNRLSKSLKPVSWGVGIDPLTGEYIFGLLSQDIMSTTKMDALVRYNNNERSWKYNVNVSYQALYPIIDLGASIANRFVTLPNERDSLVSHSWKEHTFDLGFRIPFLLSNSKYSRSITLGTNTRIGNIEKFNVPTPEVGFENGDLYTLSSYFTFSRILRQSQLDIGPRFGQSLLLSYNQTPFGGDYKSSQFTGQLKLYFPGIFKHHSIQLRGGYELQEINNYYFSSPITFTRGYIYTPYENYANFSTNYKLPLAYMDLHVGPIINIQRIYTNLFYDYGIGKNLNLPDDTMKSYGAEVSFNFNLMRYLLLFDVGLRYSYRPEKDSAMLEIIIGAVTL